MDARRREDGLSLAVGPAGLLGRVLKLWDDGLPPGDKTGWPSIDKFYSVVPGQLTVITGWPGSGKSEWLDALLINLMHQDWCTALFSPENQPIEVHASKLIEKVSGKPFGRGPTERITKEELHEFMLDILRKRFTWIEPQEDTALSIAQVIETAEPWLKAFDKSKRAIVIDPWNELEHWRPKELSETEYISQQLSYVRNWARRNKVHVFIVAHPQKMRREEGKLPVPRPDMISGSQHWWNKADNAITVWRNMEDPMDPNVEIHVLKVRFKHVGRPGVASLRYDRINGRYYEIPNPNARSYANKDD